MSILSFTYPLTEQTFIKCLVYSRYSSKYQVNRLNKAEKVLAYLSCGGDKINKETNKQTR